MVANETDQSEELLNALRLALANGLRSRMASLSLRQLALLHVIYTSTERQTVSGLTKQLGASGPSVSQSIIRLEELGYVIRWYGQRDRRSVSIARTLRGEQAVGCWHNWLVLAAANIAVF